MRVSKIQFRSISLPSRLHPINTTKSNQFHLQKLKSWQISNSPSQTVPTTSHDIHSGLLRLVEMYNSLSFLDQDEKSVETSLDSSIELIDHCNIIRELFSMIKENVQALQSALRRKSLEFNIQNDVNTYFSYRKRMNKIIAKSLKKMKNLEIKSGTSGMLSEEAIFTIAIFKCILVFLSWPRQGGWSLVSRLMVTKSVDDNCVTSEVGSVDFALRSILGNFRNNGSKDVDIKMLQRKLQNLEVCIGEIEGGLERLFRQLLKNRVTLLNVLTDQSKSEMFVLIWFKGFRTSFVL